MTVRLRQAALVDGFGKAGQSSVRHNQRFTRTIVKRCKVQHSNVAESALGKGKNSIIESSAGKK